MTMKYNECADFSQLVCEERPDFKAVNNGLQSLDVVELLSLIIGQGKDPRIAIRQARQLVNMCGGSLSGLRDLGIDELEGVQGVDPTKVMALKAVFEVARRLECEKAKVVENYGDAEKVWRYFRPIIGNADHEEAHALLMNNRFNLIKAVKLSSGGLTETAVDVRVILREALMCNATVITLVHNHPSGQLNPSTDDKSLTLKVKKACETMRIFLVDHVIITKNGYYSFNEEGQL